MADEHHLSSATGERDAAQGLLVELGRRDSPGALRDLLAVALRDPSLRVGFWISPAAGYVDAAGRRLGVDGLDEGRAVIRITSHGEPLAAFVCDAGAIRDRDVVEGVLGAAHAALENDRLHAELRAQLAEVRASRERIVTAADRERQRIERNLHDGAQQRLVSLTAALRLLRVELGDDPAPGALAALEVVEHELREAIGELRELARGIHPAILTDEGLVAALETLAARASLPVRVCAPAPDARLPVAVEVAAYFVCCEALTNAVRHSGAASVAIELAPAHGALRIVVSDDGRGGADPDGSGLRGLADRAAALGGSLTIDSPPGQGTRITATLPLGAGA